MPSCVCLHSTSTDLLTTDGVQAIKDGRILGSLGRAGKGRDFQKRQRGAKDLSSEISYQPAAIDSMVKCTSHS